jgi:hypothetical protein
MIGLHVVSPIGFVTAWLVLGPRRRLRSAMVPAAFVLPVAWLVVTFVRGALVDWYPYPFLDVTEIGLPASILNASAILVVAALLALLFRALDAILPGLLPGGGEAGEAARPGDRHRPRRSRGRR